MPDDLDNLLRAAMKTLDEQVPSGYFEALPNRTLARLEGSMQHGSSGTTETRDNLAPPPMAALEPDTAPVAKEPSQDPDERDEDSGLHDIRNLAQSTRQRMSSRRITQNPPLPEDVLAASSGSFKNIALPQPARMVSLPEIAELPSKQEVAAAEKAAKKAKKAAAKEEPKHEAVALVETGLAAVPAPAVEPRQAFTLPSQQRKGSKGPLLALLGTGLAAAAGYVIFLQVNKSADDAASAKSVAPAASSQSEPAAVAPGAGSAAVVAAPVVEAPAPAEAAKPEDTATGAAQIAADEVVAEDKTEEKAEKDTKPTKRAKPAKGGGKKVEKEEPKTEEKAPEAKPDPKDAKKPPAKTEESDPSFDALLKEAGVDQKKEAKPKLEKKSLTGDDFKKGMSAVAGKAKGCYKGTQGTAMVKLIVAPSGQVSKVSVGGDFAGKPEGSCVEAAIKSASFPPWDGGPMSFTYSVLLAD